MAGGMLDNLMPAESNSAQSNNPNVTQNTTPNESTLGNLKTWQKVNWEDYEEEREPNNLGIKFVLYQSLFY